MQSSKFPTKEEMLSMSITTLRNLDIQTQEEEVLLQEVLNEKVGKSVILEEIKTDDVPDISTPEEEAKWQAILNERRKEARRRMGIMDESTIIVEKIKEEEKIEELQEEIAKIDEQIAEIKQENKQFCEYCDSKGRVHKKDCTKPMIIEE